MKTQNVKLISKILTAIILLTTFSCNKNDVVDNQPTPAQADKVNPEFQSFLDKQKQVTLPLKTFILPNGKNAQDFYNSTTSQKGARVAAVMAVSGPQEKKNYMIDLMIKKGLELADKSKNVFTDGKETQTGIAYSYGSKDYRVLQSPTAGSCNRDKAFHGIDCSGFVYEMALAGGVNLGNRSNLSAAAETDPATWQNAIQANGDEYKKIRVEDVSNEINNQDSKLETGDIIYFYDAKGAAAHHIGIVLKDAAGQIYFLNSYGNPDANCDTHFSKGPSLLSIQKQSWFANGYNYGVLRIITDISGNWNLFIRCKDQSYDAIKYSIKFETSKNDNNVTGKGSGIDYDGQTVVNVEFTGQYIRNDNVLRGKLNFTFPTNPSGNRVDSFEIRLNDDDTGYFNIQKVVDNSGCYIQTKLINLEK